MVKSRPDKPSDRVDARYGGSSPPLSASHQLARMDDKAI
jgi:hypothetical protein